MPRIASSFLCILLLLLLDDYMLCYISAGMLVALKGKVVSQMYVQ
jgi:hypothetical protein